MYVPYPHPSIEVPDDDVKVWRYLDLAKFISLLSNRSLFLSRLDSLSDPSEGRTTLKTEEMYAAFDAMNRSEKKNPHNTDGSVQYNRNEVTKLVRASFYVNCWHINEFESAGMWSVYASLDKGIAIQSTVGRIKDSVAGEEKTIGISKVKYIDRRKEVFSGDLTERGLSKGAYYSFENELRVYHWYVVNSKMGRVFYEEDGQQRITTENFPKFGIDISVDINRLIEGVYISPIAPQWFMDIVKSLATVYKLRDEDIKIKFSDMKEEAFF
jgi:hypothetical protein